MSFEFPQQGTESDAEPLWPRENVPAGFECSLDQIRVHPEFQEMQVADGHPTTKGIADVKGGLKFTFEHDEDPSGGFYLPAGYWELKK